MFKFKIIAFIACSCLWASTTYANETHLEFYNNIKATCGHSYLGRVVESNESDTVWRTSRIIIHTPPCGTDNSNEIHIPLHVGENKSRTWIISKTPSGLRLKHKHMHEDGSEDNVSMYGGDTVSNGTAYMQNFPADGFSKALFLEYGLDVSVNNVWSISITPGESLSYQLSRPGRLFKVDFDLKTPVN